MNFMFACSHSCLQNGSSNKMLARILFPYFVNNGQCAEYIMNAADKAEDNFHL